jgi:HEPN domain-containing protein
MSRWPRGEAEVEQLVARRELELMAGAGADGTPLLAQATRTVATAAVVVRTDAYSAYVLAYDAARFACIALLAQFGEGFRPFADLRRRRNELEYPHVPGDTATADEAEQAIEVAERLIDAAGQLLDELSFFA